MPLVAQVDARELARLLAPIDAQVPAGLFDVEDETYQAVDQEMVKLGGLHELSIDWAYIEEASRQYLAQQCKHLRIAMHLSVAWLRGRCWEHWVYALALLAGLVEHYWESAYPKPGPTGFLAKRKLVALMINRMIETLPRLDGVTYRPDHAPAALDALHRLLSQQAAAQLDPALLGELERLLEKHTLQASGAGKAAIPSGSTQPPAAAIQPVPLAEVIAPPTPRAARGNEREARRAMLIMAEQITQQDPYDPTGYQLRRFGLWAHLQAAPQIRQGNRTELMAVPRDIAGDYEDAITAKAVDAALLLRIEKSVTACPYWIRGSYLAATAATEMAMGEVAHAIRVSTARLVLRMPALQQLSFSDGQAFVDDQCLAWLKGSAEAPDHGAPFQEFGSLRDELVGQLETGGVEPVLLRLQAMQTALGAPRERCHTTVIAADLLAARGIGWLARDLCAAVARTMQETAASAWEPEVFQRLQQYAAPSMQVERIKEPESR